MKNLSTLQTILKNFLIAQIRRAVYNFGVIEEIIMTVKKQIMKTSSGLYDSLFCALSVGYHVNVVHQINRKKKSKDKLKVLEIGCFDGRFYEMLKEKWCFTDYSGVDYNPTFIGTKAMGDKRTQFLRCDITDNNLDGFVDDDSQDVIVCSEVLEHVECDEQYKVHDIFWSKLRPGGILSVSFPENTRDCEYHRLDKEQNLGHVHFPVHEDFIEQMEARGFELLKYNSGYTIKSCFGRKKIKDPVYQQLHDNVGPMLARCIYMLYTKEHTGGGYYQFRKPD